MRNNNQRDECRVLIVDDEKHFCFSASLALKRAGLYVRTAANGRDALDVLVESRKSGEDFDMVITDIVMPVMDGIELIDKMKQENLDIPILVITGFLDTEYREALHVQGVSHTLEKPFMPDLLIERVKSILKNEGRGSTGRLTA